MLCVFCMLAGCKIELPAQVSSTAAGFAESSEAVFSQDIAASSDVSSAQISSTASVSSVAVKAVSSSAPVPKATTSSKFTAPAASQPKAQSCTLSISCSEILKHMDRFDANKQSVLPKDGIIYAEKSVVVQDGDTVFDVLLRETKANGISMVHTNSPAFQVEYIHAINNIAEKDCGTTSGWMYTVNGKQPAVGCSTYKLKSGDKIQWIYQCGT